MQEITGGDRASKTETEFVNRHRSVTASERPDYWIGLPTIAAKQFSSSPIVQPLCDQVGPVENQI